MLCLGAVFEKYSQIKFFHKHTKWWLYNRLNACSFRFLISHVFDDPSMILSRRHYYYPHLRRAIVKTSLLFQGVTQNIIVNVIKSVVL